MPRRVLILGGSRYYSRWIDVAREVGCGVVVTDRDPEAYAAGRADFFEAVDIADASATRAVAERYRVDGVLAVNDYGVPTAARVAEALGLPGISVEVAERATSKALMREAWQRGGVPSPRFRVVTSLAEAGQAAAELDCWPLIAKPADSRGGGSRGVSRIEGPADLQAGVRFAQAAYQDPTILLEECVEGTEHSVETFTFNGVTRILAISDKVKTPAPYRVDRSVIYPTALEGGALGALRDAVLAAVRALGIEWGAAHVELASTPAGPRLFELGARPGGGATPDPIVPHVSGVPFLHQLVRAAVGLDPTVADPHASRGCVYRFLMPAPGRLEAVEGLDDVRAMPGILDCEVLLAPGAEVRPVRTGSDRAGFVVAAADARAEAIALADRAEQRIVFRYDPGPAMLVGQT
jgi:S-sulfo-L-cysteine synthase (3-phospho-L-serine-dependent)